MKKLFFSCFLIVMLVGPAFAERAYSSNDIVVTDPDHSQELAAISAAIDAISGPVTRCINDEKQPISTCQCREKDNIEILKQLYTGSLEKHPDWAGKIVNYSIEGQKPGRMINFDGLKTNFSIIECP